MEYPKTSLDTLIIFDSDEDIQSDEHSSLESYIMKDEENVQPKKHHRHKSDHHRRHHKKDGSDMCTTKQVTQKIHVDRHFKCSINLNTTVCDHSNHQTCNAKPSDKKSQTKKIVPQCLRQKCHQPRHHTRFHKNTNEKCTVDVHAQKTHAKNKFKKHTTNRCRHGKKPKQQRRRKNQKTKLSTSNEFELELEDISTTSLDSYMDTPTSYKHVNNPRVRESKLDKLIRKAKERDRKLMEQSRNAHKFTDTSEYTGMSFLDFSMTCSEIDAFHSQSTFMELKKQGYSPSIEGLCPSPTFEKYYRFSNVIQMNDFELDIIKSTMPIEAYSPTYLDIIQGINKVIKIEPKLEKCS